MNQYKIIFYILIFLVVFFEVIADILFKRWSLDNKNILLIVGLLLYFIAAVIWAISLRYEFLSKAISLFAVLNVVLVTLAGVILFKENLSLINKIGIALGIASIILIELF